MSKSKCMKFTNNIHETKKNLFIDEFMAAQGCPLDLLHGKAVDG